MAAKNLPVSKGASIIEYILPYSSAVQPNLLTFRLHRKGLVGFYAGIFGTQKQGFPE